MKDPNGKQSKRQFTHSPYMHGIFNLKLYQQLLLTKSPPLRSTHNGHLLFHCSFYHHSASKFRNQGVFHSVNQKIR